MIFCVFSYNRGQYLKNCISSIEKCASNHYITIYDDNSTDPDTVEILQELQSKYKIYQPNISYNSKHHLGGLYGNMQKAFEEHSDSELLCFLQDDTQIVRTIDNETINEIEKKFTKSKSLAFISPCFIRGINLTKGAQYNYDENLGLYFKDHSKRSSGMYFSALLITKPKRLSQADWSFLHSEPANDIAAQKKFSPMGYLHTPFAMWLPEVPAYRGKKKTLGLKLAEKKRNCGYYPYKLINENELENIKKRSIDKLPIAETFLKCEDYEPPKPWSYNPLTRTRLLKKINQLEIIIKRIK